MDPLLDDSRLLCDLLARHRAGDDAARDELLNRTADRLHRLTRHVLREHPLVHRWEETGDVAQNAALRLWTALRNVRPETPVAFFRLAAQQIRRELVDLARKLQGPEGLAANHASMPDSSAASRLSPADVTFEPARLAAWTEFHETVEALPDEEREMFDLLWYQGLSQPAAAEMLSVAERTVRRRWRKARSAVYATLFGAPPTDDPTDD